MAGFSKPPGFALGAPTTYGGGGFNFPGFAMNTAAPAMSPQAPAMPGISGFGMPYWMRALGMSAPQATPITPFVPPSQMSNMPQPSMTPFPGWQMQFGHPAAATPAPVATPAPAAPSQAAIAQMVQQAMAQQNNPDLHPGFFGQFGR